MKRETATAYLMAILLLQGCTGGGAPTSTPTPAVPIPEVKVKVSNPLASKAVSVADAVTINASGELNKGTYQVGKHKITVDKNTTFTLAASMPIKGSAEPDLAAGTGTLTLSNSISFDGFPVPTKIEVKSHSASASLDFVGIIVTLINNSLPHPGQPASDPLANIVHKLDVSNAEISLRPDQPAEIGGVMFKLKPGSKFLFKDIKYTSQTNYQGHCTINLAGAQDLRAKFGDNDVTAKELSATLTTHVAAANGKLTFTLDDPKASHITLTSCKLASASDTIDLGASKLTPTQFQMVVTPGNWKDAAVTLAGHEDAQQVSVNIDQPGKKLTGNLPAVDANFYIALADNKASSVSLTVPGAVDANAVNIGWHQGNQNIDLDLTQAKLDQLSVKMPGAISVEAASGEFGLSELHWQQGSKAVSLKPKAGRTTAARIVLPSGLNIKSDGAKQLNCKVKLGPGVIDIATGGKKLTLDDLTGTADVAINGTDLNLKGAFSTTVIPRGGAFGIPGFDAELGAIGLQLSGQKTAVTFDNSKLLLSESELTELVQKHLPASTKINVDKELIQQTPWRYKAVTLKKVEVTKPSIQDIHFTGENNATANCSAPARLDGTVEKLHPIGALLRRNEGGADVKSWSAAAVISGPATAKFVVVPGKTLADSKVKADVGFELKKLDQTKLDWSGVSGSILGKAESGILTATLAAVKGYIGSHSIPLHTSIEKPLVKHSDPRMKMISIRSVKLAPTAKGVQILLSGSIALD